MLEIGIHHGVGISDHAHGAAVDPQDGLALLGDVGQVVRDENDGLVLRLQLRQLVQALRLERGVPHGENLVDEEDVGVGVGRHREAKPHLHARRVVLDGRVDEALDFREGHDLIELALNLPPRHPHDGAVEEDVLAARQVRMETGADLDERAEPPIGHERAGGGHGHAGEHLQERALARPVSPDQPQRVPPLQREADVTQRPELLARRHLSPEKTCAEAPHLVLDRGDVPAAAAKAVPLGNAGELDGYVGHEWARPLRSRRRRCVRRA